MKELDYITIMAPEGGRGFYIMDVAKDIETYVVCKREH